MSELSFENDARTALANGMWYNSPIPRGYIGGPVSGDAMTSQIAFGAAIESVQRASGRSVSSSSYIHTGFECDAL